MSDLPPAVRSLARHELARILDHTCRHGDATAVQIDQLCAEAREHGFFSVCVNGSRVTQAAARLEDSRTLVTCAVGFPFGGADADVRRYEIEAAIDNGAQIFEVTVNTGRVRDGDPAVLLREFRDFVEAADERPVSLALDALALTADECLHVCRLAVEAGAKGVTIGSAQDFAASLELVRRMVETAGDNFGIKLDCRHLARVEIVQLLDAGATRFGLEEGVTLLHSL